MPQRRYPTSGSARKTIQPGETHARTRQTPAQPARYLHRRDGVIAVQPQQRLLHVVVGAEQEQLVPPLPDHGRRVALPQGSDALLFHYRLGAVDRAVVLELRDVEACLCLEPCFDYLKRRDDEDGFGDARHEAGQEATGGGHGARRIRQQRPVRLVEVPPDAVLQHQVRHERAEAFVKGADAFGFEDGGGGAGEGGGRAANLEARGETADGGGDREEWREGGG